MQTRHSLRQSDDISPEEIEKLFAEQDKKKKSIDLLEFAAYVDDSTDVFSIEQRFAKLDMLTNDGVPDNDAARKVYVENALPGEIVDIDKWLNDIDNENNDEDEFIFNKDFEHSNSSQLKKQGNIQFNDIFQVEKFGASIEKWPSLKYEQFLYIPSDNTESKMKNFVEISNTEFKHPPNVDYISLPSLTPLSLKTLKLRDVDGYVIDPPVGCNNYSENDLEELLNFLKMTGKNPYFIIWIDPDNISLIASAARKANLDPCDSACVELFDSTMQPISIKTKNGFTQHSRMLLLYRCQFSNSSTVVQQNSKDTDWGIVYPNGKSHGRYGMPMTGHKILEGLLQHQSDVKERIFVELWPSRYSLREKWISIDESI